MNLEKEENGNYIKKGYLNMVNFWVDPTLGVAIGLVEPSRLGPSIHELKLVQSSRVESTSSGIF